MIRLHFIVRKSRSVVKNDLMRIDLYQIICEGKALQ